MNRIQEVLDEKGISQIGLAKALGIARSSVSQYCSNKIQPPLTRFMAICEHLGCEASELLVSKKNKK
jgi:putative transcriptional regulator